MVGIMGCTGKIKESGSSVLLSVPSVDIVTTLEYTPRFGDIEIVPAPVKQKRAKEFRECGLPGCKKTSLRDYCSSEHCKEHRKSVKVKITPREYRLVPKAGDTRF